MVLMALKQEKGWNISRWHLTYRVGWSHILKAVESVYDFYDDLEILAEKTPLKITSKEDISSIKETASLTFRGVSKMIKVPVMITIYNQTNVADVSVAPFTEEFATTDYEKFNKSMCSYLDSIELAMHR